MRHLQGTFTPFCQTRAANNVSFAALKGEKQKWVTQIRTKASERWKARERGATLTDSTGRNISRTDLDDFFSKTGKLKSDDVIAHGKSPKNLEDDFKWLDGIKITEPAEPELNLESLGKALDADIQQKKTKKKETAPDLNKKAERLIKKANAYARKVIDAKNPWHVNQVYFHLTSPDGLGFCNNAESGTTADLISAPKFDYMPSTDQERRKRHIAKKESLEKLRDEMQEIQLDQLTPPNQGKIQDSYRKLLDLINARSLSKP